MLAWRISHWTDKTSEEYLTSLADASRQPLLLIVTTYRPGYTAAVDGQVVRDRVTTFSTGAHDI